MTTLIRLLKLVRRLNVASKICITIRGHTFKKAAFQRLLHSQALFLTNQKYEFTTDTQSHEKEEISEEHKMINLFQQEIQKYGRLSKFDIEKLLEEVKASGFVSSLQGHFLLQCCSVTSNRSQLARRLLAEDIWRTLKEIGTQMDVSHYNALFNVYAETDHQYSPEDFLDEMVKAGIKPNRVTFQKLIAHYCNEGQVREASQLLNRTKSEGISVNEDMLSSFIYGHFLNNNDDAALEILKDMEKLNILPSIKTYSTFLYVYGNRGEIDNLRNTLKECEAKGIWVPDKVLLRIVHNLSLHGFSQYVDEILALTSKGNLYLKEATKFICKLVEKHQYETAFKIYQTLPENRTIINGNTFLQALINTNAPLEKSIEYCRLMEAEKLNPLAFLSAVRKTIAKDMYTSSISLMKAWKHLGGVIRASYFAPILKAHGEAGQYKEITNVVEKMILEFDLQPTVQMLRHYIIPYIPSSDDEMLPELLSYQIDSIRASNAVLVHLLEKNEIRKAVKFMSSFSTRYKADIVKSCLLEAFTKTEDVPSFVWILHYLYVIEMNFKSRIVDNDAKKVSQEFIDSFILETINLILSKNEQSSARTTNNKYLILALFRNLIDKGINLSTGVVDDLKTKLSNVMTPEIEKALATLKSDDLILKPVQKELENMSWKKKLTNMEKLESLAKLMSVTNKNEAIVLKKKLLYYYCNTLNEKKIYDLLQEFEFNGIEILPSTYATVIDTFLRMHKIEEAEMWLIKARGMIPEFHMSKIILLKLATAVAERGYFQRALECLNQPTFSSNKPLSVSCKNFLSAVMKFDDENYLLQAFDVLKENGYFTELENLLVTPLVLLYIERGDTEAALKKFEWSHKVYGLAPCQIQLMKVFIKNGDEKSLYKVKAISEKTNGSLICYFNLALAYLENSQLDEAKRMIEKHVPRIPEDLVFDIAEFYYDNGKIDYLEKLFDLLNNLHYDVERLCVVLIRAFGHYNEWEKGYKLWMKMQVENIKPSNTFVDYLNLVVNKKGSDSVILKEFADAVEERDELKTRQLLEKLPLLYKRDGYSKLCKKYCQSGNFSEVIELCKELRNRYNLNIHPFDAEFILDNMVKQKDVASVEKIGIYMHNELKNQIKYNFYLNHVYLVSGSWNLYLKDIEKRLLEGNLNWKNLNMHVKTAVESLFRHPELLDQYESIAHMCNEKNIPGLIHALWIYYFMENDLKAETLWAQYIKNSEFATWLEVKNFKRTNNPETYVKIAELLKESALKPSTKFNTFNSLIERCLKSDCPNKYEYGVKCLIHATQILPMESFNIDLLVNLQIGLENSGKEWPWSERFYKTNKQKVKSIVEALMKL